MKNKTKKQHLYFEGTSWGKVIFIWVNYMVLKSLGSILDIKYINTVVNYSFLSPLSKKTHCILSD